MAQLAINLAVEVAVGALIGLLTPSQKVSSPRLNDLSVPKSSYGVQIPKVWGSVRLTGNLIWAGSIREVVKKKKKRRGKGFGSKVETTTYSYYGDFAVLLCAGPIVGVKRIWLNSKLVYNVAADADANTLTNSKKLKNDYLRIYTGSESQLPDPLIQATMGIENTPAYRHRAYLVFHDLPLVDYGNRFPSVAVEVCTVGSVDGNGRVVDAPANAATIIKDICIASDLAQSEVDTGEINQSVTGFFINSSISAREALSQLQQAYFFDCVESNGKLKFINSERPSIAIQLKPKHTAAYEYGTSRPPNVTKTRIQDLELPTEICVTYFDPSLNYAEGMQYSRKYTSLKHNAQDLRLPLVLTPTQALTIADRLLYLSWTRRSIYKFSLSLRHCMLEPGDTIVASWLGTEEIVQISKINIGANLLLEIEASAYEPSVYSHSSIVEAASTQTINPNNNTYQLSQRNLTAITQVKNGSTTYTPGIDYTFDLVSGTVTLVDGGSIPPGAALTISYTQEEVSPPSSQVIAAGDTTLRVLDVPLIADSDADSGLYLAADGSDNWHDCTVYVSRNGGSSYDLAIVLITKSTFGSCNTTLAASQNSGIDNINSLSVTIRSGELESVSLTDLNNGDNIALVGNEIIRFQIATLTGERTYTLSNLLRGSRGTEWAQSTHTAGESFYLLSDYLERVEGSVLDVGKTLLFKAVTAGQSLDEVSPTAITVAGNSLKPYSPVNPTATKDPLGNITISWTRRDRKAGDRTDYANLPMSEVKELYEIDVYSASTIVRTVSCSTPSYIYTAENQMVDFGRITQTIVVKIYQISGVVGRGYALVATLTPTLIYPPPTIINLTPTQGAIGTDVAIAGNHFTGTTAVYFNGTRANFTINSDTTITATVPSDATSGSVTVTTPGGYASI